MAEWIFGGLLAFSSAVTASILTWILKERTDRKRLKLWVFGTLMQYRFDPTNSEAVKALNSVDALFHNDREVRNRWHQYYTALSVPEFNSDAGMLAAREKNAAMLIAMATALGLSRNITENDVNRVYHPGSIFEETLIRMGERKMRLEELRRLGHLK